MYFIIPDYESCLKHNFYSKQLELELSTRWQVCCIFFFFLGQNDKIMRQITRTTWVVQVEEQPKFRIAVTSLGG